MELPIIPEKVKKLWDKWDLRLCIIISLSLQAFLLLLAPFRQRSRSQLLFRSVWATYLLADWIAAVAIGLISKSIGDLSDAKYNDDLFALWASFLLMHLGGPDGITSLSLEDNELWIRHLFGLILQVVSALYSFYLTLTKNKLWLPSILVFIAGSIKFAERTWALNLASLDSFGETSLPDPNPGPDYEEAASEYSVMWSVQLPTVSGGGRGGGVGNIPSEPVNSSAIEGENFDEMKQLEVAHSYFEIFKGLIVGFLLSAKDRASSRGYFLREDPIRAFKLVECELSFMYQVLHTKSVVIHSTTGYILRFISFCSTVVASLLFVFVNKSGFGQFEKAITYSLFIGAIVLDVISIVKFLCSDWVLLTLKDFQIVKLVPKRFLSRSRWSGSVSQDNMISYCLPPIVKLRSCELYSYCCVYGVCETINMMLRYSSSSEKVPPYLKKFLIEELQSKSSKAINPRDAIEACSQRGDSALLRSPLSYIKLKWSIGGFQYAESLLVWHLATELCCYQEEDEDIFKLLCQRCCMPCCCTSVPKKLGEFLCSLCHRRGAENSNAGEEVNFKGVCKIVSDYMFYLIVNKPVMLAPVLGNWNIVFQDTRAEAKRFFKKHKLSRHSTACKEILSVKPKVRSSALKGNRSRSVLFDACILAQQLQKEGEEEQWRIMSRVWVELLSYAAINCRPFVHAQQLSKGGELLTFTWLLMNHLGLGTQFADQEQVEAEMAPINE